MDIYIVTGFTKWGADVISAHHDLEIANKKAETWLKEALTERGFTKRQIEEAFDDGEELDLDDETYYKVSATTLD